MIDNLYPPSPQVDDLSFIKANRKYRTQAMLVMASIVLFFLLYLAMVAGAAYLVYWSIFIGWEIGSFYGGLARLGVIASTIMLFVFTLKFLFKKHNFKNPFLIEITEAEHPKLFAFIRKLSSELNAPFPKKVYVNHEINASVFYNSTVLSLFFPVKKNLLIGLGLVNSLNLSEFKAVLAHEFGHFSQRSMKLGSYIYMSNRIIHSMVYERDKWDEFLERWKSADIRLSIFAWILMPFVWVIRKLMQLIYQLINIVHASLSRQMEFQADRVAVSVTGNQAIVNSLYKLNIFSEAFAFSNNQVGTAFDHKLYTNDLFYHQTEAFEHLKKNYPDFEAQMLDNQNSEQLFHADDANHIAMYASHPANHLREKSAKEVELTGPVDDRSPWELFDQPARVRQRVTQNVIRLSLDLPDHVQFHAPEEVEAFIKKELSETTYHADYQNVYDDRYLTDIAWEAIPEQVEAFGLKAENAFSFQEDLYGDFLSEKMTVVKARSKDLSKLYGILTKQDRSKNFQIRGNSYTPKDAEKLYEELAEEVKADESWYEEFDAKVIASHYVLMQQMPDVALDFERRYRFHIDFQKQLKKYNDVQNNLKDLLEQVYGNNEEMTETQIDRLNRRLTQYKNEYERCVKNMRKLQPPALQNMEKIDSLEAFVQADYKPSTPNFYDGPSVQQFYENMGATGSRMRRIYFKSLGGILNGMEAVRTQFSAKENSN